MKLSIPKFLMLAAGLGLGFTATTQAATCSYEVVNNWGSGFQGAITITNNGTTAVNGWTVDWKYTANKITNSWNATLSGGNPYSATALDWNKTIQPGQSVSFGVQGDINGGTAEKPTITGSVCSNSPNSSSAATSASSSVKTSSSSLAPSSSSVKSSSSSSVSSSKSSLSSATSSSSSSVVSSTCSGATQCNWYGTRYPSCTTTTSGWGYENGMSCIANSTCTSQPAPYGVVSACGVSSSSLATSSSSSIKSSSSSSVATTSSSSKAASSSSVSSVAQIYPNYNTSPKIADSVRMGSTATQIAAKIKLGFNIGNTLEATGCPTASESCWGNPKITPEFVKFVKQSGFTAIRLPTSWNQYANQTTAEIDINWLNRVKEVVQYCVDNDLYVIVNIHWDGGWLENNVTPEKQIANNAKQKAFWEQIATQLRDFDEHLIFAGTNEPNVDNATQMNVLLSYHQTFINAVRATGGKNAYRVLIVQGPSTDIEKTNTLWTQMPTDTIANKLMAEVHFYTPYNFTLMTNDESWGKQFYYWGKDFHSATDTDHNPTWGEEDFVNQLFSSMKTQFIDKGIPVIIGEFTVSRRNNLTGDALKLHLDSRAYYYKYVTKQAITNGLLPFYWDTGSLLDRNNNSVLDQQALDALIQGAAGQL